MSVFWDQSFADDKTAVVTQTGESLSYSELYSLADTFAAALRPHSLVFIYAGNNIPTLAAYLGCLRNGHVSLLISSELNGSLRLTLEEIYQPDYIYAPNIAGEYELTPTGHLHSVEMNPELALLLSTSGSTGSPKLVRLSHANIQANAESIAQYLRLDDSERPVTNLPIYYSYGLSVINSHLQAGATLLLTDRSIISPEFWVFCDTHEFTSLAGVPYTYDMLEAVGFRRRKCPSLRYMTQAGGHMSAKLVQTYAAWAEENQMRFYVMYGQTEATARMSYLPPSLSTQHPDSIGVPIPGGAFSIDASDSDSGELIYRGKNVSLGYAESRHDLSLGDSNCGVLRTGDIARVDSDGLYYIVGRLKRFIKISGNRFGLDEMDSIFQSMGIEAVCGGGDGKLQIAITNEADKQHIAGYLKETWHLMRNQYTIKVVDSIPRSSTGKILYSQLFS